MSGVILVHVWGALTGLEARFWRRVDDRLRSLDLRLALTGMCPPSPSDDIPYFYVPYSYPRSNGLTEIYRSVERGAPSEPQIILEELSIDAAALIRREEQWTQHAPTALERSQWQGGLAYYASAYLGLLDHLRPRLVVIWNGFHPGEIILHQLASAAGCPTAYVERGPFPKTLYFDEEGILARSSLVHKSDLDLPESERGDGLAALEFLREMTRSGQATWWDQSEAIGAGSLRSQLQVPAESSIVLFAEQLEADTQSFEFSPVFRRPLDAYEWLNTALSGESDLYLLGKSHPFSRRPPSDWENLRRIPGTWRRDVSLFDVLDAASHVAAINSTVLYEAMLAGKPALAMGDGLFSGRNFFYEVQSPDDEAVVRDWVRRDSFESRVERFETFCSYLLRRTLYSYGLPDEQFYRGLRAENFAETMSAHASPTDVDYESTKNAAAGQWLLRLATDWVRREQELEARMADEIARFGRLGKLLMTLKTTRGWKTGSSAIRWLEDRFGRR